MMDKKYAISDLAKVVGGRIVGDSGLVIHQLATLQAAGEGQLSFFANPRYLHQLEQTHAAAVLVKEAQLLATPCTAIVVDNPYLAFAKLTALFDWRLSAVAGIAASAVVAEDADVSSTAQICAGAVIESGAVIAKRAVVGANSVVGRGSRVGTDSRLEANVTLYPNVHVGERCIIHSGAVLGADGFGFAPHKGEWVKINQLGGVRIGNDVEVGANTTIDRGALDNTQIENGVKLDNQIQIAHNVVIGEGTAIAGCTAVARSTKIGRHCTIAGLSGITGHLEIADGTHVTAMSLVSKSIKVPGAYSSGTGIEPHQQWKRNVVRFRQLDELAQRVRKLEKTLEHFSTEGQEDDRR